MIKLSSQEIALYRKCVNEVLQGFYAPSMEQTVGVSYAVLMKEDANFFALHKSSDAKSSDVTIPVRPLVIEEAIRRLGWDDFQKLTGVSVEEGYRLIEKAKKAS